MCNFPPPPISTWNLIKFFKFQFLLIFLTTQKTLKLFTSHAVHFTFFLSSLNLFLPSTLSTQLSPRLHSSSFYTALISSKLWFRVLKFLSLSDSLWISLSCSLRLWEYLSLNPKQFATLIYSHHNINYKVYKKFQALGWENALLMSYDGYRPIVDVSILWINFFL